MAQPKIGHNYRLDVEESLWDEPIPWINNKSKKLYSTWGEIVGNIVTVKAVTQVMTTFYIVHLAESPKDTFYAPRKLLIEITRRLPIPCTCELKVLLNQGCKCGAFQQEQSGN